MTVAILIVCHDGLGQCLVETASSMLANKNLPVKTVSVPSHLEPQQLGYYADQVRKHITDASLAHGVLVLTDICGATPNNLARYFAENENIKVISGLNLPMLVRVLNYHQTPLGQLADIAVEGGRKGIIQED